MKYDYLIVGSGLYGSICANELHKRGKKVIVIDKRSHYGGNVYNEKIEEINVHKYGAHIFHTSDKEIWEYFNQFCEFNNYINSPIANYKGRLYNLPFNMNTFYQFWGTKDPEEAKKIIESQIQNSNFTIPKNLEETAISMVGTDIYETLIKGYTLKQWGKNPKDLPSFIIKRLPLRFTYDNNYFNDKYQGIPIGGYNQIFQKLLDKIEVKLNINFFEDKTYWESLAHKIIFTGPIDEYFDYKFGKLEYRSLKFENEIIQRTNYQGVAVMNYTDENIPYTRIIEHKHFEKLKTTETTVITKEYSVAFEKGNEPYYPVNDSKNNLIYDNYKKLALKLKNIHFGGRLGSYRYYDMHQVAAAALKFVRNEE